METILIIPLGLIAITIVLLISLLRKAIISMGFGVAVQEYLTDMNSELSEENRILRNHLDNYKKYIIEINGEVPQLF